MHTQAKLKSDIESSRADRRAATYPTMRRVLDNLGVIPLTGKILEIGAGSGDFSKIVPANSIQFDNDREALAKNPSKNKKRGNALSLSSYFQEKEFDFVIGYSFFYLFNKSELQKILIECSKVLKDDGRILIANDHYPFLKPLIAELAQEGLTPFPYLAPGQLTSTEGLKAKQFSGTLFHCIGPDDFRTILGAPAVDPRGAIKHLSEEFAFPVRGKDTQRYCDWLYSAMLGSDMTEYFTAMFGIYQIAAGKQLKNVDPVESFWQRVSSCLDSANLSFSGRISAFDLIPNESGGEVAVPIFAATLVKKPASL